MPFLVFAGRFYYPGGGWLDYIGTAGTLDAAEKLATGVDEEEMVQWFHIVQADTGQIVRKGERDHDWSTLEGMTPWRIEDCAATA